MKRVTINASTGRVAEVDLTQQEVAALRASEAAAQARVRRRQRALEVARKRDAALRALQERQLRAAAAERDALPEVVEYVSETETP